jgi:hypothetical protein
MTLLESKVKSYGQFCGIAKALDLIGQRWTALILRELLLGPRRYSELQRSLSGITTNLLAKRMRELEAASGMGAHGGWRGGQASPARAGPVRSSLDDGAGQR